MFALPVVAQERGFRSHRFDGTAAGGWQFLVDRPWYATGLSGAAGLTLDYSYRSLVPSVALGPGELRPIVEHAWIGHADLSLSVLERVLLSVNLPVTLREAGAPYPAAPAGPAQFTVIGDPRLGLTYRLFGHAERDRFSVHLGLDGWAPIGAPGDHQGDTGFRLQPRAVFAGTFGDRGHWGVETALLLRPYASIGPPSLGLIAASEARVGLALGASFLDGRLRLGPEVRFSTQVVGQNAFAASGMSLELLGGAQLLLGDRLLIGLAGGTAFLDAAGTPDARAMIRVGWAPRRDADGRATLRPPVAAAAPSPPPTPAGEQVTPGSSSSPAAGEASAATGPSSASAASVSTPASTTDSTAASSESNSASAKGSTADSSPSTSDPRSSTSTAPGLDLPPPPVLDADGDGVTDAMDRCPFEPETLNGIRDRDGCPEPELDRGTPLARILAPEANLPTNPPVTEPAQPAAQLPAATDAGKPDSDGDGVVDEADRCPVTPEDADGFEDGDGCPELDNDADGVPDARDQCPLVGETVHGAGSRDGCPKLPADADQDGVTDDADRCPFEPETRNGLRDEDGCPEPEGRSRPALARLLTASPAPSSSAPAGPGDAPAPAPSPLAEVDSDRDGIPDDADRCPLTREDADGFEDLDGCPEPDNDGDGVQDRTDRCPLEAETPNGWRDEDGCADERSDLDADGIDYEDDRCPLEPGAAPDGCPRPSRLPLALPGFALANTTGDSGSAEDAAEDAGSSEGSADAGTGPVGAPPRADYDQDGLADDADACPASAEDADGFEDEDGCAEPDNDSDGVPDRLDRCPLEAETINGNRDSDGCPDPGLGAVTLSREALVIDGVIGFRKGSARLERTGTRLLQQVALTLKAHPSVSVEIQGHTDDTGSAATNIRLSQQRADAIRTALVRAGVAPNRLVAKGYGPTRPRGSNLTPEGRELNRRVEFLILGEGP